MNLDGPHGCLPLMTFSTSKCLMNQQRFLLHWTIFIITLYIVIANRIRRAQCSKFENISIQSRQDAASYRENSFFVIFSDIRSSSLHSIQERRMLLDQARHDQIEFLLHQGLLEKSFDSQLWILAVQADPKTSLCEWLTILTQNPWIPWISLQVHIVMSYRYGNIFREVINSPVIDWCRLMDNSEANVFIKMTLDLVRETIPQVLHKCPYHVSMTKFCNV